MKIQKKLSLLLALSFLLGLSAGGNKVMAADGAESYNYSYWGLTTAAPAAYQANGLWNGESTGAGAFKEPGDFHVTGDKQIYVLDSGHNRIVVLDEKLQPVQTIRSFARDGKEETFNNPQGLFVTDSKELVVADTGNKRIVQLDRNNKLVKVIDAPKSDLLSEKFDFQPVRVVVDKAQRIYVMSAGVYDGFMEFSPDGTFTSFVGANRVSFNPTDYLWKMLSTKAQRSQMVMFTPTEFTNLDIDQEGFIYATNGQDSGNVKKLNAQGNDILRRNGYFAPEGDIRYMSATGPSRLIDIDVGDSEMYSILDGKRGRVFTYDGDGHLLYVFGGLGNQMGQFNTPVAIERLGDEFLVLDKALGEITVFETTEYGRTLNEAVRAYYNGDENKAYELYQETISMNANLEFAYAGIGKALLRQGDYREAMKYFKKSMDQKGYSKAFLLYRKEVLREYFPGIMTGMVLLIICWFGVGKYRKRRGGKKVAFIKQRAV
ncbi:hypothetical protein M3194_21115 [Paenibacillus glycanilyticus]|uniref:hypothetical protein n=1 Tax=Paenibacillus glycanilyticus TaxID=126569 RepID=UPI002041A2C4|nr:hypothetical protein [Paenibacillus glycanilyticus]MCM3629837.1 hypothetical protein [Paenibacillus glycanilyticus]